MLQAILGELDVHPIFIGKRGENIGEWRKNFLEGERCDNSFIHIAPVGKSYSFIY